ncbi:ATP-dependent zinc metalloprotease FtsH [Trueperella bialowiezensis]|uniref:ATP-dependent zinc metalloprotease FtsH n=1 Tax=Trueperella bialowiezensis TaxID=312285 RepID=A0A3S4VSU8_9ACTO|nr:ATP-dependent zinc metalloprotease FtsH [Trueperella bialowiezensis]VEI12963.1 ATP-dependent zinc metalloprotease FtsH [Trueperella bialowiezensis]
MEDKKEEAPKPWRVEGLSAGDGRKIASGSAGTSGGRPWWQVLLVMMAVWGAFFALFSIQDISTQPVSLSYTDFKEQVENSNVAEVYSRGDSIEGKLKEPVAHPDNSKVKFQSFTTERPTFADDDLLAELESSGADVRATPLVQQRGFLGNFLLAFGPLIIFMLFWWWMSRRALKNAGGMGMFGAGKKKFAAAEPTRVTFDDVAGIDEVENEVAEVVDFLKNPDKYAKLGAKPPRGVLLTGEPGTGKTLLARATAGEAEVPFFSASASEFIEMVVGVGAQRVRQLFEEARKVAPSIIFIDEIDTIGRARGGANSIGGHDEREQTLNQILTEMDGFDGSEGVVVMAATNRADVLDPALTRPGRFDRTIQVHAPDADGREQILKVHVRNVPLADDVDLHAVAAVTPGMTGAALANLVNEAAIGAAKREADAVSQRDLMEALEKVQMGPARDVLIDPDELRKTAYHEAGHALLGMLREGADPVRKISIIPRGRALGVTVSTPEKDRYGFDEHYLRGRIIGALGGWAAEKTVYGVTTSGVDNDLEQVTKIARTMVGRWGMSEKVGAMSVLQQDVDPRQLGISEQTLKDVDDEARRIIAECQAEALQTLEDNRDKLDAIVDALMEHETLDEAQAYAAAGLPAPSAKAASVQG